MAGTTVLHTYSDRYGTRSHRSKQIGPTYGPEGWAHWEQSPKLDFGGVRQRDDLGPTAWNCHLHPSLRFSGSSNHLIHAFLAVASPGNLCPPNLLHLGTQHSVPRLFLLSFQCRPLQRINRITLMAVAPSGEYQISLYLSLSALKSIVNKLPCRKCQGEFL